MNSQSSLWKGRQTGSEVKVIDPNIHFLTIKYEIQEENSKKTYATQTGLNSEATNKLISQEIILSCSLTFTEFHFKWFLNTPLSF